jgi:hypothetical protein
MSKVLLIEPHKVLQQALALSLFPEHEVKVEESIDAAAVAQIDGVDLLIIDAAAMREKGKLTTELKRALGLSKAPLLWIDDGEDAPARERLVVIAAPLDSTALQSAVADLLSSNPDKGPHTKRSGSETGKAAAQQETQSQLIDLVEVVEEASTKTK